MKKIESMLEEFEALSSTDERFVLGGQVSPTESLSDDKNEKDTNYVQCHCNNYQCGKEDPSREQ
jgi:hypothetical protein